MFHIQHSRGTGTLQRKPGATNPGEVDQGHPCSHQGRRQVSHQERSWVSLYKNGSMFPDPRDRGTSQVLK